MTSWRSSRFVFAGCGHPDDHLWDADEFTPLGVPEDVSQNAVLPRFPQVVNERIIAKSLNKRSRQEKSLVSESRVGNGLFESEPL